MYAGLKQEPEHEAAKKDCMMDKVSVAFVPGLAADERLWRPVTEKLDQIVWPIMAQCKGESIAAWADEILAIAPEHFYVAGTSMGGYVALEVALRGDERLAGLILLNTNARSASPQQRDRGVSLIDDVRNGHFDQVADKLAGLVGGGNPEASKIAALMMREAGPEIFVRQQQAVLARKDRRAELPQITVPTLVIAGDNDLLVPPSVNNEMARLIPNAELEILPCGHMSTVEASADVADKIRSWLEKQKIN